MQLLRIDNLRLDDQLCIIDPHLRIDHFRDVVGLHHHQGWDCPSVWDCALIIGLEIDIHSLGSHVDINVYMADNYAWSGTVDMRGIPFRSPFPLDVQRAPGTAYFPPRLTFWDVVHLPAHHQHVGTGIIYST